MSLRNTRERYGSVAKWLHGLTALCMLPALAIAAFLDTLHEDVPGDPAIYFAWMPWHKTFGFLVLCLIVLRLPWALANARPAMPDAMTRWQQSLAHAAHRSLYGLMVLLPALGWLGTSAQRSSFKLFDRIPMPYLLAEKNQNLSDLIYEIHVGLGWTAMVLVAVHIGAALWHHYVWKDRLLRRMWIEADAPDA